jgi:uncharacterized membrane protein
MIRLQHVYLLVGVFLGCVSWFGWRDRSNPRRWSTGLFWGLLAVAFLAGERLPAALMGALVLVLALLAGTGGVRAGVRPADPQAEQTARLGAARLGHRLLLPALLIPGFTLIAVLGLKHVRIQGVALLEPANLTLVALGLACLLALAAALRLTRASAVSAVGAGRRILDAIGWAALLPLLLATLGSVFSACGVGEAVAALVRLGVPADSRLAAVLAYGLGMVLLTMIMGNAFAAFPVMTAGVGLPLLIRLHGADPAIVGALGMLTGYCGTLLTPMAANFNIVPVALLELPEPYAVIRAQAPTAALLLLVNLALMLILA